MASIRDAPTDAAVQQRIIRHMNADHQNALSAFAQYYGKITSSQATGAYMTDINLSAFTLSVPSLHKPSNDINVNHKTIADNETQSVTIPLEPPMKSYRDARERMASMAKEACAAYGVSEYVINKYSNPPFVSIFVACSFLFSLYAFASPENFAKGHWIRKYGLLNIALFADFLEKYSKQVGVFLVALHLGEVAIFWRTRIWKYHMKSKRARALWSVDCFLEGFGAFKRFDDMVVKAKNHK